ncbi:MAG: ABC transporter permease [Clostridiaceae bacterium]|jgi:peptide/nickel transport system permease protein|nr:ABC transporter permease [Clostridiaceae bacterium]
MESKETNTKTLESTNSVARPKKVTFRSIGRFLWENKSFTIGLLIVLFMLSLGIFADYIVPHDAYNGNPREKLLSPFWMKDSNPKYVLGTDYIGRDTFSRICYGLQVSIIIGFGSVAVSLTIALVIGIISGLSHPSLLDSILMRLTDVQMAFPFIVLAIIILSVVEPTIGSVILVLGLCSWAVRSRVIRSSVMIQKESDYVAAGIALGASKFRIAWKYILRNLLPSLVAAIPLDVANAIVLESLLSYMQIGLKPPIISLGSIMGDGRNYMASHWWMTAIPGFVILFFVLGLNLMGDTLQKKMTDVSVKG